MFKWLKKLFRSKTVSFMERPEGIPLSKFRDYESYIHAGCRKVWATWKAIDLIAQAVSETPFDFYKKGTSTKTKNPALSKLFAMPNQFETITELFYLIMFHVRLTGNAFMVKDQGNLQYEQPRQLFLLNPKLVKIVPDKTEKIKGYIWRTGSGTDVPFEREEIIHFKRPHPDSDYYGLGDMEAAEPLFNDFVNRENWSEKFWKNGASPSGLLVCEDQITDEAEWEKAKAKFQKQYGGVENSGKTAWLTGKWQYTKLGLSAVDMQDLQKLEHSEEVIFHLHGVPLSVAGVKAAANYACLPAGELVETPLGPVAIEKLKQGDPIWQWSKDGLTRGAVVAIIPQPEAQVFEIKTPTRTLRASDNHPLLIARRYPGRGAGPFKSYAARFELEWRRADALRTDDRIIKWESGEGCGTGQWGDKQLSTAFMELAGLFTGDGDSSDGKTVRWAIDADDHGCQEIYASKAEIEFAALPRRKGAAGKASRHKTYFAIHSASLADLYEAMGFCGNALSKQIPAWVFTLKRELKLAYLRGLLDSDGTVDGTRGQICFCFANKQLTVQVRSLCMDCGVPVSNLRSRMARTNFGTFEIHRFTCGFARFNSLIGSNHPRKLQRLQQGATRGNKPGLGNAGWWTKGLVMPPGFAVERIINIKALGKMPVFDLAATNEHTFIAGGVVVHNTAEIDEMIFRRYGVKPMVKLIRDTLQSDLVDGFDPTIEIRFDVSGLINMAQVVVALGALFDRGVLSINEMRDAIGMAKDDNNVEWNQHFINAALVPLELAGVANQQQTDQAAQDVVKRFIEHSMRPQGEKRLLETMNGKLAELQGAMNRNLNVNIEAPPVPSVKVDVAQPPPPPAPQVNVNVKVPEPKTNKQKRVTMKRGDNGEFVGTIDEQ